MMIKQCCIGLWCKNLWFASNPNQISVCDYADDIQTINEETSFPDTSANTDIKLSASTYFMPGSVQIARFFPLKQEDLSNWFIAIINCIPRMHYDKYSTSTNFGRPSPAPPSPKPPPGPRQVSHIKKPVLHEITSKFHVKPNSFSA